MVAYLGMMSAALNFPSSDFPNINGKKSKDGEMLVGKRYEALLKNGKQGQAENKQPSILTTTGQRWGASPSQKIFTELFILSLCLGLPICNTFLLLLLFSVMNTP